MATPGLRIDDRTGSKELAKLFLPYGIQPKLCRLPFGDFAWEGAGPDGVKVGVVAERKTIGDLLDSIETKRLSGHQLPGISEFDYGYLLVEGVWRQSPTGMLEVPTGKRADGTVVWTERGHRFDSLVNFLMGMSLRANMLVWQSCNPSQTAAFLVSQYRMWNKDWDDHTSHDEIYIPAVAEAGSRRLSMHRRIPSQAELHASLLPGIARSARYVAQVLPTVEQMVEASPEQWASIKIQVKDKKGGGWKARNLGPTNGKKAWEALRS